MKNGHSMAASAQLSYAVLIFKQKLAQHGSFRSLQLCCANEKRAQHGSICSTQLCCAYLKIIISTTRNY